MTDNKKPNWKKLIDLIVVILTAIGSFIGGNVTAKNSDFKIKEMINKEIQK